MSVLSVELTDEKLALIELVRAAQAGDREAFGQLVERFEHSVYASALRRVGNHVEAQELTQEVFVQALRKIGQLREPECFGGWLRTITTRLAINRRTRGGQATPTDRETLEAVCLEHETPVARALARERQTQVRAGLDRLGELDRDTLVAFYMEGQSLLQMSTAFDSPVGTIKRRLHVARKRLARQLEELGV
ncbi:MAG TPA: sigma-70 family RNA polymerase sigma factor [Pirellulales bacterium]|nr:sigma-70 family RNA polymerase sigma factor [Pirellulales bacterium]